MKTIRELQELLDSGKTSFDGTTSIETCEISDCEGNKFEANIVHGWDLGSASQCDSQWGAFSYQILEFIKSSDESIQQQLLDDCHLEDFHWQWLTKHKVYHSDQYNWFFLMVDGKPQASCLIYHPKKSSQSDDDIFYIEFLAVAPWNRPNPLQEQSFKGLGSLLLKTVIMHAENDLGMQKGFSLHSLPKAEGFYSKIGMIRVNSLDKDSLAYFEMLEKPKQQFLGEIA
ncbi:GNAT family N-acetyltransferase [Vibrio splendidus]|uniref:GNAT family N-acetyltransferase n=1 Tax=Vibrio splendidus TaxID=29497 RepID=UPI000C84F23C|nr:GNAT family N-acetyltransferase [Vibrio splendidus]PMG54909.1 hypothetical protein BCU89_14555 [Vibrio splendidus]